MLSAARPLVSVITPTWNRSDKLKDCIAEVQKQTYGNIEHVIVEDGTSGRYNKDNFPSHVQFVSLGYNTSQVNKSNFGIVPLTVGMFIARGKYQMWLSDDDTMHIEHIEKLVNLLEETKVDFVYSKCHFHWREWAKGKQVVIGTYPPKLGHITNFLYHREILDAVDCLPVWGSHPVDWALVEKWMAQGLTCAMLDEVTFYHNADQT